MRNPTLALVVVGGVVVPSLAFVTHSEPAHHWPRSTWQKCGDRPRLILEMQAGEESIQVAQRLRQMVEDISEDQTNEELMNRITSLEQVLQQFVEMEGQRQQQQRIPRPPGIPPPLSMLGEDNNNTQQLIGRAEEALQQLRNQWKRESEALMLAEEALERSIREQQVLQQAEEALQRSRQAAEKRKQAAIRRTAAAVASSERLRSESSQWDVFQQQQQQSSQPQQQLPQQQPALQPPAFFASPQIQSQQAPQPELPTISDTNPSARSTMSLDSFAPPAPPRTGPIPRGIPILCNWVQQENGSVAGQIQNSDRFPDGARISTSPIRSGSMLSGQVVETSSGSRYFLGAPMPVPEPVQPSNSMQNRPFFANGNQQQYSPNQSFSDNNRYEDPQTIQNPPNGNAPRSTFSLLGLLNGAENNQSPPSRRPVNPNAVPTLSQWTSNPDGTLTGIVHGSPHQRDGDMVTTSPVVAGQRIPNQQVQTSSGSRYYLCE